MTREQLRFLASGVLFGFLVGYLLAFAVHEPDRAQHAATAPAAGNMGMGDGIGPAPMADAAAAPAAGGADTSQMMAQVFEEIQALKDAIAKDPRDTTALMRLANLYHDARKYPQAIEYYEKALEVTPANVDARTDMGICMREMGRADDAIVQFRRSLTYDARHWQSWLNLGVVSLLDKNDLTVASEAFAQVEALNPGFKDLALLKEEVARRRSAPAARKAS